MTTTTSLKIINKKEIRSTKNQKMKISLKKMIILNSETNRKRRIITLKKATREEVEAEVVMIEVEELLTVEETMVE